VKTTPAPHDAPDAAGRPGPRAVVVQIVGLVISLSLLVWSASLAVSSENAESLERLADAPLWATGSLVALVLVSIVCNGLIFQIVLAHTRRLGKIYLVGVTAIATLVAYAPFKMSLIVRALIHRRRDAMLYRTLIAWFAATSGLSMCVIGPVTLASAWRPQLDATWIALALIAPAALLATAVVVARWVRTNRPLHLLTLGSADYATDPRRVAGVAALRYLDLGAMALRFYLAAQLLGIEMTAGQAVVAASIYFLTGLLSPSGNLGVREGAVTGVGFLPAMGASEQMALVALTVTAAEIVGAILGGVAGTIIVRPDKLLRAQRASGSDTETSVSDDSAER